MVDMKKRVADLAKAYNLPVEVVEERLKGAVDKLDSIAYTVGVVYMLTHKFDAMPESMKEVVGHYYGTVERVVKGEE